MVHTNFSRQEPTPRRLEQPYRFRCDHASGEFVTPTPAPVPHISVVIAAYDDWPALEQCLDSLFRQNQPPNFEIIVVDDGSRSPAPDSIQERSANLRLQIVRVQHSGISSARNYGIQVAKGPVLLFTDCDCVLELNCLRKLADQVALCPQDDCFQLHLTGKLSSIAGRAEDLQLSTVQRERHVPSGHLRYLNTSGFAIRRTSSYLEGGLFDPFAKRGEDTLLLSRMISKGQLPRYAPEAVIQHAVRLPLPIYVLKGLPSGYLEGYAYSKIRAKGVRLSSNRRLRWRLLRTAAGSSGSLWRGALALTAVVARQSLNLLGSLCYSFVQVLPGFSAPKTQASRSE